MTTPPDLETLHQRVEKLLAYWESEYGSNPTGRDDCPFALIRDLAAALEVQDEAGIKNRVESESETRAVQWDALETSRPEASAGISIELTPDDAARIGLFLKPTLHQRVETIDRPLRDRSRELDARWTLLHDNPSLAGDCVGVMRDAHALIRDLAAALQAQDEAGRETAEPEWARHQATDATLKTCACGHVESGPHTLSHLHIQKDTGPHVWIQWKGTNVCCDVHCECGYSGHYDGDFMYFLKCPKCERVWEVGTHMPIYEVRDGRAAGHNVVDITVFEDEA